MFGPARDILVRASLGPPDYPTKILARNSYAEKILEQFENFTDLLPIYRIKPEKNIFFPAKSFKFDDFFQNFQNTFL